MEIEFERLLFDSSNGRVHVGSAIGDTYNFCSIEWVNQHMVTGLLVDIGTRDLCQGVYYKANWKNLFIYSEGDDQIYESYQTPAIMSRYILCKHRKQAKRRRPRMGVYRSMNIEEMPSNQHFQSYLNAIANERARRFENSDLLDCYNFGDFKWDDDKTATGYLVCSDTNNDMSGLTYKASMATLMILDENNDTQGTHETPIRLKHDSQILETKLNEITRLLNQMKIIDVDVRLINAKTMSNGTIFGEFSHNRKLYFKVNFNFITVYKRGFICREDQYKLLIKNNTDIIFPKDECKIIDDEDEPCCVIF
ncbi:hypothetical protein T492DRAFT_849462 [Pavlovales sp. CCMP2436]|nr:hypothetical protein T492DRAFT_849462 [Pavlovales sp. CCMP2436]